MKKLLTKKILNEIKEVSDNKHYKVTWLSKRVEKKEVEHEDIYKFSEYFAIFEKHKRKFAYPNIHHYNTTELVVDWINECIKIQEQGIVYDDIEGMDNYVSQNEIERLCSFEGNEYYGLWRGYQVFRIGAKDDTAYQVYKNVLGKVAGRDKGASLHICTFANDYRYNYYLEYSNTRDNDDTQPLFLLFNLRDTNSPYQLHFESTQFMDKNNDSIIFGRGERYVGTQFFRDNLIKPTQTNILDEFLEFIGKFDEYYNKENYFNRGGFNGIAFPYLINKVESGALISCRPTTQDTHFSYKTNSNEVTTITTLINKNRWRSKNDRPYSMQMMWQNDNLISLVLNLEDNKKIITTFRKKVDNLRMIGEIVDDIQQDIVQAQKLIGADNKDILTLSYEKGKNVVRGFDENGVQDFEGITTSISLNKIGADIKEKIFRYPNGKKKRVERYKEEKQNGWTDYYDEKGKKIKSERYQYGELVWSSDYTHKPLSKKKDFNADFDVAREKITTNIANIYAKGIGMSVADMNKREDKFKELRSKINEYTKLIQDLEEQIEGLSVEKRKLDIETTNELLTDLVKKENVNIVNKLAPFIDDIFSQYPDFQRKERTYHSDSYDHKFPYEYVNRLGYRVVMTLKRRWFHLYESDTNKELLTNIGESAFRFDMDIINANGNSIISRSAGYSDNQKYFDEIQVSENSISTDELVKKLHTKIKFYAEFINKRVR